jgi:hypothetical protein
MSKKYYLVMAGLQFARRKQNPGRIFPQHGVSAHAFPAAYGIPVP